MQFGLVEQESSSSNEDKFEYESCAQSTDDYFIDESYSNQSSSLEGGVDLSVDYLRKILDQSNYNWFEVCNFLESNFPNADIYDKN